jgi:hypothetical protein
LEAAVAVVVVVVATQEVLAALVDVWMDPHIFLQAAPSVVQTTPPLTLTHTASA